MNRVVAFIVARLTSSRLPRKQLRKIGDKRLIDWVIENTKHAKTIDEVVLATTDRSEDNDLSDVAKEHGIGIFRYSGDENDVVGRLTAAAIEYNADVPVLVSGDCPLIYPQSLNRLVNRALSNRDLDCVIFCKRNGKPAIHEGMMAFRLKGWIKADRLSDKPNLREHQFPIIFMKSDKFRIDCVKDEDIFYKIKHRISVDTLADLEFMNAAYDELKKGKQEFNLKNVIELLLEKPELMKINADVHQIGVNEKQKKALIVIEKQENLKLFFDIAYFLTKKGIGVSFFSSSKEIKFALKKNGFESIEDSKIGTFDFFIKDS